MKTKDLENNDQDRHVNFTNSPVAHVAHIHRIETQLLVLTGTFLFSGQSIKTRIRRT